MKIKSLLTILAAVLCMVSCSNADSSSERDSKASSADDPISSQAADPVSSEEADEDPSEADDEDSSEADETESSEADTVSSRAADSSAESAESRESSSSAEKPKSDATEFSAPEYGFKITLPEGIETNAALGMWEKTPTGGAYMMAQNLMLQSNQNISDIRAELFAYRYPNEEDDCDDPLPYKSFDDRTKELSSIKSDYLKAESSEVWNLGDGRRGFVVVYHFPQNDTVQEQTSISAQYEYSEDTYILFNLAVYGHDKDAIDRCIKSAKSFKYSK